MIFNILFFLASVADLYLFLLILRSIVGESTFIDLTKVWFPNLNRPEDQ